MKKMDMFCASEASTAISCLSINIMAEHEPPSILLGRTINRHNPIIRDARRVIKPLVPCVAAEPPPITPKPLIMRMQVENNNNKKKNKTKNANAAAWKDEAKIQLNSRERAANDDGRVQGARRSWSWSCTRPADAFLSPPPSSRYLLTEKLFSHVDPLVGTQISLSEDSKTKELFIKETPPPPPTTASSHPPHHEVAVVLRVSLHCRGCEKKMKKHIARMEGVTSFDVDFMAKKVTVIGNVTPLGVLSSISKVKNAELWHPPPSTTS